jgi:hypothetical protein
LICAPASSCCRRLAAASALLCFLSCPGTQAAEVELSLGGGIGSSFTRRAPFELDGFRFAGPYRSCPEQFAVGQCRLLGLTDVELGLESRYSQVGVGGLEVRTRVGGPFSIGAGVLGGAGLRKQRLIVGSTGDIVDGRPMLSDELATAADARSFFRTNGVGALAYVHAGVRAERGFSDRTFTGVRSSPIRIFLEAGGGLLAAVPGGGSGGIGQPAAIHVAAGLSVDRLTSRTLVFTLRHVRAVGGRDEGVLVESDSSFTVLQVGWRLGR